MFERYNRYTIWVAPHSEGMMVLEVDALDHDHLRTRLEAILNPDVYWSVAGIGKNEGIPTTIPLDI